MNTRFPLQSGGFQLCCCTAGGRTQDGTPLYADHMFPLGISYVGDMDIKHAFKAAEKDLKVTCNDPTVLSKLRSFRGTT